MRRAARRAAAVLFAAGVLALGYAAYVVIDTKAYRASEQRRLERLRNDAAAAAARALTESASRVVPREPAEGESIGEISISRLGLVAIVAQGDTPATLRRAVGHLSNTALPGADGNVVLAGHRDTFFRPLKDVRVGDAITLTAPMLTVTCSAQRERLCVNCNAAMPSRTRSIWICMAWCSRPNWRNRFCEASHTSRGA